MAIVTELMPKGNLAQVLYCLGSVTIIYKDDVPMHMQLLRNVELPLPTRMRMAKDAALGMVLHPQQRLSILLLLTRDTYTFWASIRIGSMRAILASCTGISSHRIYWYRSLP